MRIRKKKARFTAVQWGHEYGRFPQGRVEQVLLSIRAHPVFLCLEILVSPPVAPIRQFNGRGMQR